MWMVYPAKMIGMVNTIDALIIKQDLEVSKNNLTICIVNGVLF
jgi:hypothetical protein